MDVTGFRPLNWQSGCFVDQDGVLRHGAEFGPDDLSFSQQDGWVEVHILDQPDGEPGRAVLDSFVFWPDEKTLRKQVVGPLREGAL